MLFLKKKFLKYGIFTKIGVNMLNIIKYTTIN